MSDSKSISTGDSNKGLSKVMETTRKREQLGTVYDKQPELLSRPRTIPGMVAPTATRVNTEEFVDLNRIYGF